MAGRRYADDVSVDRYEERREYTSRNGRRGYDDRYVDEEIDYRRSAPVREREVLVRDEVRDRPRSPPAFLREDYGRTTAGPLVLAKREREDFEFVPRPRRRSPSPEIERKVEKEEIIIRKRDDESESRPAPRFRERERERDREEIIIRRDDRERDLRPPPPREVNTSREEIIIRRDEDDRRSRYDDEYDDRDDVISRRGDYGRRPARGDVERDEIIIRREEQNLDPRRYDDYAATRPRSRERARSRARRSSSAGSNQEIIIRQEEREGRGGTRERQEIIVRRTSRSRSPASVVSMAPPRIEPQVINAPTIHQEVVTHHRHVDHGFELAIPSRPRPISRPPSPPSPPLPAPPRARSEERIEISRTQTRNGRTENENIFIDRNEGARSVAPNSPPPPRDLYYDPRRDGFRGYDRNVQEEADYYNSRAMERAYIGEGFRGATRDWAIVDVPPGTNRVQMDGAGGGSQEITWQRFNGVRRSRFMPDGVGDGIGGEVVRPVPLPEPIHPVPLPEPIRPVPLPEPIPSPGPGGEIGRRWRRAPDPKEGLWTEITKDLVVREAIQEMGYEFEETNDFFYIIAYLRYVSVFGPTMIRPVLLTLAQEDVARLVGLSEDIRKDRRRRAREIGWEKRVLPPPVVEEVPRPPLLIEPAPLRPRQEWDKEERFIEREVVFRGGRPPPPVVWRR